MSGTTGPRTRRSVIIFAVGALCVAVLVLVGTWVLTPTPPQPVSGDPAAVTTLGDSVQARPSPLPSTEDPPPRVDAVEQARQLSAYVAGTDEAGRIHREVSARIDAAELDVTKRAWVHAKVQAFLDARGERDSQVSQGAMSERDAASNEEEALAALEESLQRRTPAIAAEVAALL